MKRLAIAGAGLAVVALAVVIGLLFFSSSSPDRLARAVPAGAFAYLNAYLQPSTSEQDDLFALIGRLPGFADPATLDDKIHQLAQRFVGEAGIDYEADVRPWLGSQLAIAVLPGALEGETPAASPGSPATEPRLLLLASVRAATAEAAAERIATRGGASFTVETHRDVSVHAGEQVSWAVLDDLLLVASDAALVRAAIDADAGASPSLGGSAAFTEAMRRVPADQLGSAYVDLAAVAAAGGIEQLGGYGTVALALLAEDAGLHVVGDAPFDAATALAGAREAFALGSEPSSLAAWLPPGTLAEAVVFGAAQTIAALEEQAVGEPALAGFADLVNQVRAVAGLGLGINVDRDLLPLLDRETAVALVETPAGAMVPLLLIRPSDAEAAAESLVRMRDALEERGFDVTTSNSAGTAVTAVDLPEIGPIAYAVTDGVVVLSTEAATLAAVLEARDAGGSLAETEGYRAAFTAAGTRGGNEVWADVGGLVEASGEMLGLDDETRAILLRIGAFAFTAPAHDERLEIHAVITVE